MLLHPASVQEADRSSLPTASEMVSAIRRRTSFSLPRTGPRAIVQALTATSAVATRTRRVDGEPRTRPQCSVNTGGVSRGGCGKQGSVIHGPGAEARFHSHVKSSDTVDKSRRVGLSRRVTSRRTLSLRRCCFRGHNMQVPKARSACFEPPPYTTSRPRLPQDYRGAWDASSSDPIAESAGLRVNR